MLRFLIEEFRLAIEEAKALPVGTKRVWKAGTFVKTTSGWRRLKGKQTPKKLAKTKPKKAKKKPIKKAAKKLKKAVAKISAPKKAKANPPAKQLSEKAFIAHRKAFRKVLTDDEANVCLSYSNLAYATINNVLRRPKMFDPTDTTKEQIKALDKVIKKSPLAEAVQVARGTDDFGGFFDKMEVGTEYTDKAFTSTSATEAFDDKQVALSINVPKGYPAAPIPSMHEEECEYLLPRGTKFRVVSKDKVDGKIYIGVDVVA